MASTKIARIMARLAKNPDSPYAQECNSVEWPNVNNIPLEEIIESDILNYPSDNRFKIREVTCGEVYVFRSSSLC